MTPPKPFFKIEHGLPITPRRGATGLSEIFRSMKPGDSVLLPLKQINTVGSTAIRMWGNKSYAMRMDRQAGTVRVWRRK